MSSPKIISLNSFLQPEHQFTEQHVGLSTQCFKMPSMCRLNSVGDEGSKVSPPIYEQSEAPRFYQGNGHSRESIDIFNPIKTSNQFRSTHKINKSHSLPINHSVFNYTMPPSKEPTVMSNLHKSLDSYFPQTDNSVARMNRQLNMDESRRGVMIKAFAMTSRTPSMEGKSSVESTIQCAPSQERKVSVSLLSDLSNIVDTHVEGGELSQETKAVASLLTETTKDMDQSSDNPSCDNTVDSSNQIKEKNVCRDLSFVLFSPRKINKKGRPSPKKKKKRERQKCKKSANPLYCSSPQRVNNENSFDCLSFSDKESSVDHQSSLNSSSICFEDSQPGEKKLNPVFSFLIQNDSDESEDDSDETEKSSYVFAISPVKGDFEVSFDDVDCSSSVKSQSNVSKDNDSVHFTFSVSLSESESEDFSTESLPECQVFDFQFTSGLCLENIFQKQKKEKCAKSNPSSKNKNSSINPLSSQPYEAKNLAKINRQWNIYYPTSDFGTCNSSASVLCHPHSKVKFAESSLLETVHEIGNEDRRGEWQLYAIDRQRFQKRVNEFESLIQPFFSPEHRRNIKEKLDLLQNSIKE